MSYQTLIIALLYVWMFISSKSVTKIENLHKTALRFGMVVDYSSSYERILEKSGKFPMEVKENKLCIEIYKTNNLNNLI